MDAQKERLVGFDFTAKETGEYQFYFDDEIGTATDSRVLLLKKLIDFEIAVSSTFSYEASSHSFPFPSISLPLTMQRMCCSPLLRRS